MTRKAFGYDVYEGNEFTLEDFQTMVNNGAEFVVIRSSYGLHSKDSRFLEYCAYADQVGLKKMAYHYGYAKTVEDSIQEAANCAETINNSGFAFDIIFYDIEEDSMIKSGQATEMAKAFLDNLGLNAGIYASESYLSDGTIDWKSLGCAVWNAEYGPNDDIQGMMWQFQIGKLNGKDIDMDYEYLPD